MKKLGIILSIIFLSSACFPHGFRGRASTGIGPVRLSYDTDLSTTLVISVAAVLLATKIGYDISWHNTYTTKTNEWFSALECLKQQNKITSLNNQKLASLFSVVDHEEILQLHTWINNAYGNWFTPWNWTTSLKQSREKLQIIEILTLYADLIAKQDTLTGTDLVKSFRCKFGSISIYPLLFAYAKMDEHIEFIRSTHDASLKSLFCSALDILNNFKILLRQENEYQEEVKAKRAHDLQQELIAATYASRH